MVALLPSKQFVRVRISYPGPIRGRLMNEEKVNDILNKELGVYEMATVGHFIVSKGGKPKSEPIKVFVTDDAGRPQVHVHVRSASGRPNSCLSLTEPKYFLHDRAQDKLTTKQLEALVEFFNSPSSQPVFTFNGIEYKLRTQWDYTVIQWNVENQLYPNVWLTISRDRDGYLVSPEMPNYLELAN